MTYRNSSTSSTSKAHPTPARHALTSLAAACLWALSACGGAGDASHDPDAGTLAAVAAAADTEAADTEATDTEAADTAAGHADAAAAAAATARAVRTRAQASALAARSVHAVLAYDAVLSQLLWDSLFLMPESADDLSGVYDAPCDAGSVSFVFDDADHGGTLSKADTGTLTLSGCRVDAMGLTYDGQARLEVLDAQRAGSMLTGRTSGSIEATVDVKALRIDATRKLSGRMKFRVAARKAGEYAERHRITSLEVDAGPASLRLRAIDFNVNPKLEVDHFAGTATASIDGLGPVEAGLSLARRMKVARESGWQLVPASGSARVTTTKDRIAAVYGRNGKATLRVDRKRDGSVDWSIPVTSGALDAWLTPPPDITVETLPGGP